MPATSAARTPAPGPVRRSKVEVPGVGTVSNYGDESSVLEAVLATGSHAVAVTATERLDGKGIRDLSWELEKLDIKYPSVGL